MTRGAGRRAPLVVAVGNPDRGDDGVGAAVVAAVVERALADGRLPGFEVRSVLQLTPELAADVAAASVVVVVDARVGALPGRVGWAPVEPDGAGGTGGALSHHLAPGALVGLAALAYGRVPPAFAVTVGAASFEAGTGLSPAVEAAVEPAVEMVVALAAGGRPADGP